MSASDVDKPLRDDAPLHLLNRVAAPKRRVLFAPYYPSNPYQRLLATALQDEGVEVHGVEALGVRDPSFVPALQAVRPDVLHLHWLHPYFARDGMLGSLRAARRYLASVKRSLAEVERSVWTAHNLVNHEGTHPRIDRYVTGAVADLVDRIIAHGESARRRVLEAFGHDLDAKIDVAPMGHFLDEYPSTATRSEARARLDIDDETFVILFVGRIRPYKGVFELMEAFADAPLPDPALLLIAGRTLGERPRLRLKKRCKRAARVRLDYGHIEDHRMQDYLAGADVTALPYRDVLTSSAVVLNMSFGAPVVAPRVGCITDVLHDDGGVLYDPERAGGLRGALVEAHACRDQLPAMGAANRERIAAWPWSRAAASTARSYAVEADDATTTIHDERRGAAARQEPERRQRS